MLEWALRRVTSFSQSLALLQLSMSPALLLSALCCDAAGDGKDEAGRLWPQTSGSVRPTQEGDHWDKTQRLLPRFCPEIHIQSWSVHCTSPLYFITAVGNALLFLLKEFSALLADFTVL